MKVWIVYASAGSGHKVCAYATQEYIPGSEVYDLIDFCHPVLRRIVSRGYAVIVKYVPSLWALIYYVSHWTAAWPLFRLPGMQQGMFRSFVEKVRAEKPQVIICTHFFVAPLVAALKKEFPFTLINIVTDFDVHRYWISAGVDEYLCASRVTKGSLTRQGVPSEKIYEGIPIRRGFLQQFDTVAIRKKYAVQPGQFFVLMFASNMEAHFIKQIIRCIPPQIYVYVITGGNVLVERALKSVQTQNLHLCSFSDAIWELFAAADCIITKAGGMVSSECYYMHRIPLFVQAYPGQEYLNAHILTKILKQGIWARSARQVGQALQRLCRKELMFLQPEDVPDPAEAVQQLRQRLHV